MADNHTHDAVIRKMYDALCVLMDEKDYADITITDIVSAAGVSRMAFYRNYKDKREILLGQFETILRQYSEQFSHAGGLLRRELWDSYFDELRSSEILQYIRKAGLVYAASEIFRETHLAYYRDIRRWPLDDPNAMLGAYQHMGMMSGVLAYLADHPHDADNTLLTNAMLAAISEEADIS